jgi:hypothetical protein
MLAGGAIIAVYIIGVIVVWVATSLAIRSEPTTHGQDVLFGMGCIGGLGWPVFLAYFVIASPWIAIQWWQTRGER